MAMEYCCTLFKSAMILLLVSRFCSASNFYQTECSKNFSQDASNDLRQENINRAFFILLARAPLQGFSTATYGANPDSVYGLVQCQGSISLDLCAYCAYQAAEVLRKLCPFSALGFIWYDYCLIVYDSANFFGKPRVENFFTLLGGAGSMEVDLEIWAALGEVKEQASKRASMFGWVKRALDLKSGAVTIYAMAQCTGDLDKARCGQCLGNASQILRYACESRVGCTVASPSCTLRYEDYDFSGRREPNT